MQYINELKKLGIAFGFFLGSLLLLLLLFTTLYYFNWIGHNVWNIIELIIPLFSCFLSGIVIGKKSTKKGWLEGIKLSGIVILFFLLLSLCIESSLTLQTFIYYIIMISIIIFGSMIGINFQKKD